MPKSQGPRRQRVPKLCRQKSYQALKAFFDHYDYDAHNERLRATITDAADLKTQLIGYRKSALRAAGEKLYGLVMPQLVRHPGRPHELRTRLRSVATLRSCSCRTVGRHLDDLERMGFLKLRQRTGRGLELVLASDLFVYFQDVPNQHVPPVPAAEEVALDPALQAAISVGSIAEQIKLKFWQNDPFRTPLPPS